MLGERVMLHYKCCIKNTTWEIFVRLRRHICRVLRKITMNIFTLDLAETNLLNTVAKVRIFFPSCPDMRLNNSGSFLQFLQESVENENSLKLTHF